MADFLIAVHKTLIHEGGLADNPNDPGGLTNFGISIRSHPELSPQDIRSMTQDKAVSIYRQSYWPDIYNEIKDQRLAESLFDFGVTSGVHTAVQVLQGTLFLRGGQAVDGKFGYGTLGAIDGTDGGRLIKAFTRERIRFYMGCRDQEAMNSWIDRTLDSLL